MVHKTALGVVGAFAGAIVGAIIWAIITATTNFQIGYMAVGVGYLAGFGMRRFGGTPTAAGAYAAAVIGLFGCVLGNLATAGIGIVKHGDGATPMRVAIGMLTHPAVDAQILQDTFNIMDLVFYGIAVYTAYRTALAVGRGVSTYGAVSSRSLSAPAAEPERPAHVNE